MRIALKNRSPPIQSMGKMQSILFLTSNKHKVAEAKTILKPYGVNIVASSAKGDEIQSDSVVNVARKAAEAAYAKIRKPLFVEDSGLYVDALGGFPGAFSAYIYDKLSCEGILRLLNQQRQRSAKFTCAIAYCDARGTRIFSGTVRGRISTRIFAGEGFGFDPIFIADGQTRAFSSVPQVKMRISHRATAMRKLGRFLSKRRK
jgi:XTP/dITP diphosphohydrolase